MEKNLTHNHPVVKRVYFYIFVITWLLLLTIGLLYLFQQQKQQGETTTQPQETTMMKEHKTEGTVSLSVVNASNEKVASGVPFTIQINGNSEGKDVVGFDLLLSYDKNAFTYQSSKTPLSGFQLFPVQRGNHVTLTGTKAPGVNTPTVLNSDALATATFVPNQKGTYTFSLVSKEGKETTKMVDNTTHVMRPAVSKVDLTVY